MSARAVHLLVFEGFADWEAAYAIAELRRSGGHDVRTVGFSPGTVRSMGNVAVQPDTELAELHPADTRLMILPGGDMWEDAAAYPASELSRRLRELADLGTPVAAICGATLAVARAGLLDDRRHTSNGRDYLAQHVPGYASAGLYADALAVRDRGVTTASGVGPVEFAREIFEELGVFSEGDREVWYRLFKYGEMPPA